MTDVAAERQEAAGKGWPWTQIRPLQEGADNPSGCSCIGSQGEFHRECARKVEAVQYDTAYGNPVFYCEEHALKQNEWDKILYRSPPKKVPDLTREELETIARIREGGKRRKKKEQPQEVEL